MFYTQIKNIEDIENWLRRGKIYIDNVEYKTLCDPDLYEYKLVVTYIHTKELTMGTYVYEGPTSNSYTCVRLRSEDKDIIYNTLLWMLEHQYTEDKVKTKIKLIALTL